MRICESRLDNVVYRAGFAMNRPMARQLVSHGHFEVNGRKVNIPSFRVKPGDVVTVKQTLEDHGSHRREHLVRRGPRDPRLARSESQRTWPFEVRALPERDQIDVPVQEQLIVEYYSK